MAAPLLRVTMARDQRRDIPDLWQRGFGPPHLDNLGSHQAPAICCVIHTAGARLSFLPAPSPDLNPIEQVFAKLKHLLRKAGESSKEAVWRRIATLLDQFSPQECENDLRTSGHGSV